MLFCLEIQLQYYLYQPSHPLSPPPIPLCVIQVLSLSLDLSHTHAHTHTHTHTHSCLQALRVWLVFRSLGFKFLSMWKHSYYSDWIPPTNMGKWPEAVSMQSCFVLQWDARFQLLLNTQQWTQMTNLEQKTQGKALDPVDRTRKSLMCPSTREPLSNNPCHCVESAAVLLTRAHPSVALEQNGTYLAHWDLRLADALSETCFCVKSCFMSAIIDFGMPNLFADMCSLLSNWNTQTAGASRQYMARLSKLHTSEFMLNGEQHPGWVFQ